MLQANADDWEISLLIAKYPKSILRNDANINSINLCKQEINNGNMMDEL